MADLGRYRMEDMIVHEIAEWDVPVSYKAIIDGFNEVYHVTELHHSTPEFTTRGVPANEVVRMHYADYGVKLYGNAVLASRSLIEHNPKAVAGMVRAINKALKEAIANPAESVKALKERDGMVNEATEIDRLKEMLPAIVTPATKAHGLGAVDDAQFAEQVDDIVEAFGLSSRPDPKLLYTNSFLPAQKERSLR